MDSYEIFSLIIIPFTLFFFIFDFLRDNEITKNETKIGIVQLLHHLVFTLNISGILYTTLFSTSIPLSILLIIISTIIQIGWLVNNDYCWLTRYSNGLIGTKEINRKWIAEISSLIKHYIRGDEWAYSEQYHRNRNTEVLLLNFMIIILLIKILLKRKL